MSETNSTLVAAVSYVPSNLSSLSIINTIVEDIFVTRAIGCTCGQLIGSLKATNGGEIGYLDPILFECLSCGLEVTIFDSIRHGYDAQLNGFTSYQRGASPAHIACTKCGNVALSVTVGLAYNNDFEKEGSADLVDQAQDYFDACDINATCTGCGAVMHIGDWELA